MCTFDVDVGSFNKVYPIENGSATIWEDIFLPVIWGRVMNILAEISSWQDLLM